MIMLAGVEGSGKTWAAAEATGMPIIGRSFFIEVGESMADEYGAVPGAQFEIIEHDGTYRQILGAAQWAASIKPNEGMANMLIVDSISKVWELLSDMAQFRANERARKKGRRVDGEAQITMDLWNEAKGALESLLSAFRSFPGPVILTARLDNVAEVEGGRPTGSTLWKIRGEKNIPYAAQAVVQARRPREWTLTKVASTKLQLQPGGEMRLQDFTVAGLFEQMGVGVQMRPSTHVDLNASGLPPLPSDPIGEMERLEQARDIERLKQLWWAAKEHGREDLMQRVQEAGTRAKQLVKREDRSPGDPSQINVEGVSSLGAEINKMRHRHSSTFSSV